MLPRLQSDALRLRRLGGMAVQIRGIAGAANLLYDRAEPARLSADEFRRVVAALAELAASTLGETGEPVATADPATVQQLSDRLAVLIRNAADALTPQGEGPGSSLESVSILGRLDHVRQQMMVFALAAEDEE